MRNSISIRCASVVNTRFGSRTACSAIHWSFVDTVCEFKASPVFPPSETSYPISPSLPWVPWVSSSPRSLVLYETKTAHGSSRSLRSSLASGTLLLSLWFVSPLRARSPWGNARSAPGPFGKPVVLAPAVCGREVVGSPKFPSYPCAYMPRSPQTPVVSLPACHNARKDCCLPMHAIRRLSLPSDGKIILIDHDYTYFGVQFRGLHARYTRLHTLRYRNARGFTTDLLARLWSGRTCLSATCGAPTG